MTDMDKMTMRDYAKRCGVTYECVRRTVNKELKNNPVFEKYVHKLGRTTYLDSRAVEYLDTRGRGNKANCIIFAIVILKSLNLECHDTKQLTEFYTPPT